MCNAERSHKVALVKEFCQEQDFCDECVLFQSKLCDDTTDFDKCTDELLDEQLKCILPPVEEEEPIEHDVIKHPSHYCRDGAMECIDEMVLVFGKEVVKHFALCNVFKYRTRALYKNKEEDLKKSDWYIQKYKELSDEEMSKM